MFLPLDIKQTHISCETHPSSNDETKTEYISQK